MNFEKRGEENWFDRNWPGAFVYLQANGAKERFVRLFSPENGIDRSRGLGSEIGFNGSWFFFFFITFRGFHASRIKVYRYWFVGWLIKGLLSFEQEQNEALNS